MPIASPLAELLHPPAPARPAAQPEVRPRRNAFQRIVDAVGESNRRKAEREIARYIARNGGQLTDRLEHDIARRFGSGL